MNFLAHIYLSGENENIKIGNFIADAVKGKSTKNIQQRYNKEFYYIEILIHLQIRIQPLK